MAEVAATRVVHGMQVNRYSHYQKVLDEIVPVISALVNPAILQQIQEGKLSLNLDVSSRQSDRFYKAEDKVRYQLRKLVEFYHGTDDLKFARRLTESCVQTVQAIMNSEQFQDAFQT